MHYYPFNRAGLDDWSPTAIHPARLAPTSRTEAAQSTLRDFAALCEGIKTFLLVTVSFPGYISFAGPLGEFFVGWQRTVA
jgi:hypothetical protein